MSWSSEAVADGCRRMKVAIAFSGGRIDLAYRQIWQLFGKQTLVPGSEIGADWVRPRNMYGKGGGVAQNGEFDPESTAGHCG